MSGKVKGALLKYIFIFVVLLHSKTILAQTTLPTGPQRDTAHNKSNNNTWKDEEAVISYEQLHSSKTKEPDTSIHTFHRRYFVQPWYRDLGNPGSPALNLLFTPILKVGPTLGYQINDIYRFNLDSLNFYNTTRPYSVFTYQLGSKLEQVAGIMHTQNIQPNWNFMVEYRKINAPGFYKIQRNNNDNFCLTTNYKSPNKRYTLYAGAVYNKEQHDENGGIVNDSELNDVTYIDRRTVDVTYQNSQYSISRSTISNMQRDFTILLQHSYTWGPIDTIYNADSTELSVHLKPRFSITHKMRFSDEKHVYKDLAPDSLRYSPFFTAPLGNSGLSYYVPGADSVFAQQKWFWIDNSFLINGFLGSDSQQIKFSAGIGNRFDEFITTPLALNGIDRSRIISNYITGNIQKEAIKPEAWEYRANAIFYLTGDYAGNFNATATMSREFSSKAGFIAGLQQTLGTAPYSYTNYGNAYTKQTYAFSKESVTTLYATLQSRKLKLAAGIKNHIIANYLYYNEQEKPAQFSSPFNVLQLWARKVFKAGNFLLDNELVFQQKTGDAPVNVPQLMGREQISYERAMFKNHLKIATGIEARYNSGYTPAGYSAIINQFFYQKNVNIVNTPELSIFLNFRIKQFRAFLMLDQLQQTFAPNAILFTGSTVANFYGDGRSYTPKYATQNTMLRFGFTWVMVN
ncbi:MAG: hypothetical protein H7257_03770 [Taibaiella sp.]|nr:hypothetical protein [Taibaiella sp.]